jgi:hypothetical protein
MKIYIDNFKPIQLLPKLASLEKYLVETINRIEIISETGIFQINKNSILKMTDIIDRQPIIINDIMDYTLILDKSSFSLEEVNHLPNNHISNNITIMKYAIQKKSLLFLIVEGIGSNTSEKTLQPFIPHDFYFEFKEENFILDNCKEHLIEFLSLLN